MFLSGWRLCLVNRYSYLKAMEEKERREGGKTGRKAGKKKKKRKEGRKVGRKKPRDRQTESEGKEEKRKTETCTVDGFRCFLSKGQYQNR